MERTRVVLLGASNLTLGLPTVLATMRARLGPGPLEIFVAAGHGRSYGRWSRVGLRGLPGILGCGLWPAARKPTRGRTHALLTDIGNDLAYGASPEELTGWVTACLDHLAEISADVVLTLLPVRSLACLAPWRYHLVKTVMFPGRRLPFRTLHAHVAAVNERLLTLASERRLTLVEPPADWYGRDTIHLRKSRRAAAWAEILSRWDGTPADAGVGGPIGRVSCRGLAPEWQTLFGVSRRCRQPSGRLEDGTTVSLF